MSTQFYTLVATSAIDRGHSRTSLHHVGHGLDLALTPWDGIDVTTNRGVHVNQLHGSLWFALAIARAHVARMVGPVQIRAAQKDLADYLGKALGNAEIDVVNERDHVHLEYQPKQPAIHDPRKIAATVRQNAQEVDQATQDRIINALVELRHVRG